MDQTTNLLNPAYQANSASTSSFGYHNAYPSGFSSEPASPGPMRRFRSAYPNEMNMGAQKVPFQQNANTNTNQYSQPYTNQWFESHCRGYGSAPGSRPGSVMSNMSSATVASNYSTMSGLSVITDVTELNQCYAQSKSYGQVTCENQNPTMPPNMEGIAMSINATLKSARDPQNLQNCMSTFDAIYNYAKNHFLDYVSAPTLHEMYKLMMGWLQFAGDLNYEDAIRLILITLRTILHEIPRKQQTFPQKSRNELIRCMRKFGQPGARLMVRFLVPNKDYTKYTLKIIEAFFAIHPFKNYPSWRDSLHQINDIVGIFLRVIKHELQTYREVALTCLTYIIKARQDLKQQFCDQYGIEIVLELLQKDAEERLFYRVALLLKTLLTDSDNQHSLYILHRFINVGGVTVCAKHLSHGSPRLLNELAACLTYVSDQRETTTTPSWNWENLSHMLRVVGSADYKLDSDIIGCLANLAAKNHYVKQYLVHYNAPAILMRMLLNMEDPKFFTMWKVSVYDDLMDNTLWALQMLINKYDEPVPNCAPQACMAIIKSKDWNLRLVKVLAEGLADSCSRALLIITLIITNCPEALTTIESTTYNNYPMSYYIYIRLMQSIEHLVNPSAIWDRLYRTPFSAAIVETDSFKRKATLMLSRSLRVINLLIGCDDNGQACAPRNAEFERFFEFISRSNLTPFHFLSALIQRQAYDQINRIFKLGTFYISREKYEFAQILRNQQIYEGIAFCCKTIPVSKDATAFHDAAMSILKQQGCIA